MGSTVLVLEIVCLIVEFDFSDGLLDDSTPSADTLSKPPCTYKNVSINPDLQSLSKYPEWGNIRYSSAYAPNFPFELEFQWLTCSGPLLNDVICGWSRRLRQNSEGQFHLIPVPGGFYDHSDELNYYHC
jgi:hypothetical protein